jgi:hypothetical protein
MLNKKIEIKKQCSNHTLRKYTPIALVLLKAPLKGKQVCQKLEAVENCKPCNEY